MKRTRRISKLMGGVAGLALLSLAPANVANAAIIYTDRPTFEAAFETFVVDAYSNPGYLMGDVFDSANFDILTDTNMSAISGETQYTTTGSPDSNFIPGQSLGDPYYCAGCNGSYLLDFTSTSVGTAQGVFGVGLDVEGIAEIVFGTTAFVTFGDGSTGNFMIPEIVDAFWGITDPLLIAYIRFGLVDGGSNTGKGGKGGRYPILVNRYLKRASAVHLAKRGRWKSAHDPSPLWITCEPVHRHQRIGPLSCRS